MMAHRAERFVTFSRSDMTLNGRFLQQPETTQTDFENEYNML